ncbi:MAG: hypothetical protein RML35_04350 [Chloroherpetonaceae bacterium]|nr:hypothetical protein [Chloroherpetonaceae bacterium]
MTQTRLKVITLLLMLSLALSSCYLDPTGVQNPSVTEESLLSNPKGATTTLINGLRRQFAFALGATIITTDIVSDNVDHVFVTLSPLIDDPRSITPLDLTINTTGSTGCYFNLQRLKALADFGLKELVPRDPDATPAQVAEIRMYRGMALLMLAENFTHFPLTELGRPVPASVAIDSAIVEFNAVRALAPAREQQVRIALARAFRLKGDKAQARANAQAVNLSPTNTSGILTASFTEGILDNDVQAYVFLRTSEDMQPLPRLDFLDPKYPYRDTPLQALKPEEAPLILAEIAISDNNLAEARNQMKAAIALALSRPPVRNRATGDTLISDPDRRRRGRPSNPAFRVRATGDPTRGDTTARAGLILRRNGSLVPIYNLSRTSIRNADIDALPPNDVRAHLRMLYLLRQEIFFLEGRRMSDLGIRLPVMQRQIEGNPNMPAGSPGTRVVVPDYIPPGTELDAFTIDAAANLVTVRHDMNFILAQNKVSPFPIP